MTIKLDAQEVVAQFPGKGEVAGLLEETVIVVEEAGRIWSPKAMLRHMDIADLTKEDVVLAGEKTEPATTLNMGYATTFMRQAKQVIVGVYSAGNELEHASSKAAAEGDYLTSYLYERVATAVLAKVASQINRYIEKEATARGWLVGPLLSPGSVHGWELIDQRKLCSLLDLEALGIQCSDCGVLTPFNSLSFIIGLGPTYTRNRVGSPCEVCNRRKTCQMNSGR